jgi:hypothetical protein
MDLFSRSSMTKPPSELPNENTRALSIQLTPIYSIENRFIVSMVEEHRNKTHTTVLIINNKSREEGVRKKGNVSQSECAHKKLFNEPNILQYVL